MAHNLYENTMAISGQTAWHSLGNRFENAMNAEQAITGAKLDYFVIKEQLRRADGSIAKSAFATINTANDKILGIVGARYEVIQNTRAFGFFDELVGAGEAIYETAGALGDGEKIWLLAKLPKSFEPISGDKIEQYCLLYNTHDGTLPCSVMFTPIRVVCQNTLNIALNKAKNIVKVRHTVSADNRLEEAGRIIKEMNEYFTIFGDKCHEFANFCIDDSFIKEYTESLFGNEKEFNEGRSRTVRNKKVEAFNERMKSGMGTNIPGVIGSAWWPLQAAIEFSDYDMPKIGQDPTEYIVFGNGADFKQKAWEKISAIVKDRKK